MKTNENDLKEILVGKWKISDKYGILASPEGKTLVLEPRLSKLMYLLCLNVNSIVSRDYLVQNIWQDTIVNEESLTRAIADLRKLLSENFDNSVQINTIRKRGYRLSLQTGPKTYVLKLRIKKPLHQAIIGFVLLLLLLLFYLNY